MCPIQGNTPGNGNGNKFGDGEELSMLGRDPKLSYEYWRGVQAAIEIMKARPDEIDSLARYAEEQLKKLSGNG